MPGCAGQLQLKVREETAVLVKGTAVVPSLCGWSLCNGKKPGSWFVLDVA